MIIHYAVQQFDSGFYLQFRGLMKLVNSVTRGILSGASTLFDIVLPTKKHAKTHTPTVCGSQSLLNSL